MPDRDAKVCLTFDFDAISAWASMLGLTSPSVLSRGEFAGRVAVPECSTSSHGRTCMRRLRPRGIR